MITDGSYQLLLPNHEQIFAYVRETDHEMLVVVNNFYEEKTMFELPKEITMAGLSREILLSNYADSSTTSEKIELRPYESIVYYMKK